MIREAILGTGLIILIIGVILIVLGVRMSGYSDPLERIIKGVLMLAVGLIITLAGVLS